MFPRIKRFPNKDGSTRKYLYIVENKKVAGRTKQVITANLGRLHNADVEINELIDKFSKLTNKVKILDIYKDMACEWTKEYGTGIVMRRVWQDLGIEEILIGRLPLGHQAGGRRVEALVGIEGAHLPVPDGQTPIKGRQQQGNCQASGGNCGFAGGCLHAANDGPRMR